MTAIVTRSLPIQCTSNRPYDIAAPGALVSRQTFVFVLSMRKRADGKLDWTEPGWCEWDFMDLRVLVPASAIGNIRETLRGLAEALGWEYLDWSMVASGDLEF